jgi:hypothetical protein
MARAISHQDGMFRLNMACEYELLLWLNVAALTRSRGFGGSSEHMSSWQYVIEQQGLLPDDFEPK